MESKADGASNLTVNPASTCAAHWKSVDGGKWWVSSIPQHEPKSVLGFDCYIGIEPGAGPANNKLGTLVDSDGHTCPAIGSLYMCQSAEY
jgi:hypothetical protein